MLADPGLARSLGGDPLDREGAWRHLAFLIGHRALRCYGLFAVEERAGCGGRLVEQVGLLEPEGWPGTEVAWTVARPCWGRGYAAEAAGAVLGWAAGTLGLPPPISLIAPSNARSRRVAEKLGATVEGRTNLRGLRSTSGGTVPAEASPAPQPITPFPRKASSSTGGRSKSSARTSSVCCPRVGGLRS